ncbi:hypothetical protein ANCCEY_10536 [Ancylostoma ceylanicum]|uniref:Uncharacterized protein n=1 Tax=Ancylostoma ceylanicum TaxID=53326 RepID=A0A0D6LK56_9BILA|nr:hypothetical protein ANCCEY_10536 [Ancylostoma ceylanicum]
MEFSKGSDYSKMIYIGPCPCNCYFYCHNEASQFTSENCPSRAIFDYDVKTTRGKTAGANVTNGSTNTTKNYSSMKQNTEAGTVRTIVHSKSSERMTQEYFLTTNRGKGGRETSPGPVIIPSSLDSSKYCDKSTTSAEVSLSSEISELTSAEKIDELSTAPDILSNALHGTSLTFKTFSGGFTSFASDGIVASSGDIQLVQTEREKEPTTLRMAKQSTGTRSRRSVRNHSTESAATSLVTIEALENTVLALDTTTADIIYGFFSHQTTNNRRSEVVTSKTSVSAAFEALFSPSILRATKTAFSSRKGTSRFLYSASAGVHAERDTHFTLEWPMSTSISTTESNPNTITRPVEVINTEANGYSTVLNHHGATNTIPSSQKMVSAPLQEELLSTQTSAKHTSLPTTSERYNGQSDKTVSTHALHLIPSSLTSTASITSRKSSFPGNVASTFESTATIPMTLALGHKVPLTSNIEKYSISYSSLTAPRKVYISAEAQNELTSTQATLFANNDSTEHMPVTQPTTDRTNMTASLSDHCKRPCPSAYEEGPEYCYRILSAKDSSTYRRVNMKIYF